MFKATRTNFKKAYLVDSSEDEEELEEEEDDEDEPLSPVLVLSAFELLELSWGLDELSSALDEEVSS